MGPGALAIDGFVLALAQLLTGQAVGRRKVSADGEEGFHVIAEVIGPEGGLFKQAQAAQRQMR